MILVIGATGTVGREIVKLLTSAGERVRAFTRSPDRARFGDTVEVAGGDLGDPASIRAAVSDVDAVFALSSGPGALAQDRAVAEAIRLHRTERVVKLSSVAAMAPTRSGYGAEQAEGERVFAGSGARWTILRPAAFMSNAFQWAWSVKAESRAYQCHGEIARAVVDPADIAAVAAACLTGDGHHGRTYQLTGPEALTAPQQVALLAAALGSPVGYVPATTAQARTAMVEAGLPAGFVDGLLAAQAVGDPSVGGRPLPTVRRITGHEPGSFAAWLERNLSAFR
ncbi:NAD(P)H-binding protein [Amycolatopsis sp. NPDC059021]|uniref:NAD(P)H-binding protein n=1 Tax=Amycolatopsis sp. NPDC059021 TaxID=3346704 RepID=UPI00366BC36E